MEKSFNMAFVSNYINHHQIPFCNAMNRLLQGNFLFIQTEPMEEQRIQMGWHEEERPEYVRCYYEETEFCRRQILDCDVVLFGGTDDESYITERLESGRPVVRVSERLYKTGQWKAVSPRGLRKKYHDHTRYRKGPVYLLCAGAYVPSDFHIVRAYPGKMYCWGYFPETKRYDIEQLLSGKGYDENGTAHLLWAARMIDWKHPELAIETARFLREKGLAFRLDMIGDGALKEQMEALAQRYGLGDQVAFLGYQPPEAVRRHMEKADIFLFTSDRQEGGGAVANEAMNSGCALVADHMIGAVPYLIQDGENGMIYRDGKAEALFGCVEKLVRNRELCRSLGRKAYRTIAEVWNAENAAERLMALIGSVVAPGLGTVGATGEDGAGGVKRNIADFHGSAPCAPCDPARVISERYRKRI